MCMSSPRTPPPPQLPPERAAMRQPNRSQVRSDVTSRVNDRMGGAPSTILTSGRGVLREGETERKTLLGQ